jgi:hypothetical protein
VGFGKQVGRQYQANGCCRPLIHMQPIRFRMLHRDGAIGLHAETEIFGGALSLRELRFVTAVARCRRKQRDGSAAWAAVSLVFIPPRRISI